MKHRCETFDIAIVGAGPAGSSLAIRLARSGREVLLIDKASFPRDKLCGEFVSPESLEHFEELGVTEGIFGLAPPRLSETVFHSSKGRSLTIPNEWLSNSKAASIGISRSALDNILLIEAINAKADMRSGTSLVEPLVENGTAKGLWLRSASGEKYEIRSKLMIDATGRGRYLARHFDTDRRSARAKQVAFKAHVRGAEIEAGACELFRFDGGYGGCSAIEGGLQDLCFVVDSGRVRGIGNDPREIFENTYLTNPRARKVFKDIEIASAWLTVPLANYGTWNVAPIPGVLAVGDAAAFIDPFTGSGIALALESSKIACNAILAHQENEEIGRVYRQLHSANFKWRLRACAVLRKLSRSQTITELIIGTLGASEIARHFATRMTRSSTLRQSDATNS
jgi:flavin-dependent dehydrogenase